MQDSILAFNKVMARILEFPMPTMAVFNGNAIAGGYILGLCHEFRIMHETNGTICLSELKLGMALPLPYMIVCRAKLDPIICTKLVYGITVAQKEALQDNLIDDTYANAEKLQVMLATFAKRYAALGANRDAILTNKQNQYAEDIQLCRSWTMAPPEKTFMKKKHGEMRKAIMAMMSKKKKPTPKL